MSKIEVDKDIEINNISLSWDETHHIYHGEPLYEKQYNSVMSFHEPGIAAVEEKSGMAYHINIKGEPIYENAFLHTFGYYEGIAAVEDEFGWFHIDLKGNALYSDRYDWVGNFQEQRCPVRNYDGKYFHIGTDGSPVYEETYKYAGDYKYGIAVVYDNDGLAKHIDKWGNEINEKEFLELGVFHKGYATAKDAEGYFHIDKSGQALYDYRFKWVEPFYNGQSFCCTPTGEKVIINKQGDVIQKLITENDELVQTQLRAELMDTLVGYWDTQIIRSIVKFELLDMIKNGVDTFRSLQKELEIPGPSLAMMIDVLLLWNLISEKDGKYNLRFLGELLTEGHPQSLKYAALMWGSEHYTVMSELFEALKTYRPQFKRVFGKPFFQYFNEHKNRGELLFKALGEYTKDYEQIIPQYDFSDSRKILDVGAGSGDLLLTILDTYENVEKGIILDLPYAISLAKKRLENEPVRSKIEFYAGNFFDPIPFEVDTILVGRVLHDWDDSDALRLLKNVRSSLTKDGKLILFETIVPDDVSTDIGIRLDFNLLVNGGGRERKLGELEQLLKKTGLSISEIKTKDTLISLIVAKST